MFNIVILTCIFVRISSVASHNDTIDANCTEWLRMNVTDLWESCGAQYNTTGAWQCNDSESQRVLIRFECTKLLVTQCKVLTEPGETQATEESTTLGQNEPKHYFWTLIQEESFLYGVLAGAVFLILMILLLLTVNCCLKKKRKKKSQCKLVEISHTQTLPADDVDSTVILEQRDEVSLAETQNASRHEVEGEVSNEEEGDLSNEAVYEDVVRNPVIQPPYDPDDDENNQDPTSQEQQPLYVNQDAGRVYMHLIKNKQRDDPTNLTTKFPKSSRQAEMETEKRGDLTRPPETELLTGSGTAARPSSAAYVNGHMAKILSLRK